MSRFLEAVERRRDAEREMRVSTTRGAALPLSRRDAGGGYTSESRHAFRRAARPKLKAWQRVLQARREALYPRALELAALSLRQAALALRVSLTLMARIRAELREAVGR